MVTVGHIGGGEFGQGNFILGGSRIFFCLSGMFWSLRGCRSRWYEVQQWVPGGFPNYAASVGASWALLGLGSLFSKLRMVFHG